MVKTRYDFELLKDYVEKTGVVLSKNYENEHLTYKKSCKLFL